MTAWTLAASPVILSYTFGAALVLKFHKYKRVDGSKVFGTFCGHSQSFVTLNLTTLFPFSRTPHGR